jgi:hypothetical protein
LPTSPSWTAFRYCRICRTATAASWTSRSILPFLQGLYPDRPFEAGRTRAALAWLVSEGPRHGLERIFIEPHLAKRLGVASPLIGFQGCRAARHGDHIHLQIKR